MIVRLLDLIWSVIDIEMRMGLSNIKEVWQRLITIEILLLNLKKKK